jgi:GAF domain
VTTTDAGLTSLVTQLGRARASAMDVPAVLGSMCSAIPGVLGIGGAVLLLVDPPDGVRALTASDARSSWFAETQQRTDMGPLTGALRTWRPMLTADLTRIGPPAVAAAAVECGLGSSLVLPFDVDGDRVGVLQLLGELHRPVEAAHAEMLRPLLDVLGARLADVRALRKAWPALPARPADPAPKPAVPPPARPVAHDPAPPTGRIGPPIPAAAPEAPRRPTPDKPRNARGGARSLVPAPRGGKHADPETPARSPRTGAHAVPEDPSESTTRALPTVPPRSAPAPRTPKPRSSGRHSA